jgi:glycosyltransferase involved in cell wall biosynthesis
VVYCGHNFDGSDGAKVPDGPLSADLAGRLGDDPYVLTVGTLEPRKNHVRLFRAFRELAARPEFARWKLVVVGREGWLYEDILAEAARTPGVILAGRRSHEELAALYRHAAVFAFPSLYEGFGLPVAEAMSFGLAVLTSNTSSLPEVAGDAAVLVDPSDPVAIRDGLGRLMGSPDLRVRMVAAAKTQAHNFRWDRAGREIMSILQRAAAVRPAAGSNGVGRQP